MRYDTDMKNICGRKKFHKEKWEVFFMRHMIIRGAAALLWLGIGIATVNPLFLLVGGLFFCSACEIWRKDRR